MVIEIEGEYLEKVGDEADAILGACEYMDERVNELYGRLQPGGDNREFIEDLERSVEAIRRHALAIQGA